jgi:hypothetical protein
MVEKHLRKVLSTHQIEWVKRIPISLLAYRASTDETRGTTPASMVSGRELCLPATCCSGLPLTMSSP